MPDDALFLGWGEVVRGREGKASSLVASPDVEALVEELVSAELDVEAERLRLDNAASKFVKRRGSRPWRTMREVLRRVVETRYAGRP